MQGTLSQVRDNYYAGYFSRCLSLIATSPSPPLFERGEMASYRIRAQYGLGTGEDEEKKGERSGEEEEDAVKATRAYIEALKNPSSLHLLKEFARSTLHPPALLLASAAIMGTEDGADYAEALQMANRGELVEMKLLRVAEYLLIDREDLALAAGEEMVSCNDDTVLSKLATAMTSIVSGNYQEAYLTYGDLQVQCCEGEALEGEESLLLLNGKAVANMQQCNFSEALEDLKICLQQQPRDLDTLVNVVACMLLSGKKREECQMYIDELSLVSPKHPSVQGLRAIDDAFQKFG